MNGLATRPFNGLALCAGVGGLDLGLKLAVPTYRAVCYVEREAYAAATIVARMEDAALEQAPIWDDVTTFDARPWRGIVDILTAGFPCQPFSQAGKLRGLSDERWLWTDILRIIDECGPERIFFENVPGLRKAGLRSIVRDLAARGYRVEWDMFSAQGVGAPHLRKRLFVLAHRDGAGRATFGVTASGDPSTTEPRGEPEPVSRAALEHADEFPTWPPSAAGDAAGNVADDESNVEPHGAEQEESEQLRSGILSASVAGGTGGEIGGRPLFPPRPDDLHTWGTVLTENPALEPAVCGMAYGTSERMDRLRACGNGVVPLAAAYAYRTLSARIGAVSAR